MNSRNDRGRTASGVVARNFDLLAHKAEETRTARRTEVLQALASTQELTTAASNLTRGDTYRVVLSRPVRGSLNARADGLLDAFVKKEGKIVAVARLQRASSALISSATALAGHAMLVQISAQIDHLQGTVEQVLAKMDAERLGKVDAALAFLAQAKHYRSEHHKPMLLNAVQTLTDVLSGTIRDVDQGIAVIPTPQKWNISRALWDTTKSTATALDRAESSMRALLMCLTALGQVQIQLNAEDDAAEIMRHWIQRILDLPLTQAEFLARRLPIVHERDRRDRFWIETRQTLERALERINELLDVDRPLVVQLDVSGSQLAVAGVPPLDSLRADPTMRRN